MTADELVKELAEKYRNCKTYQDVGNIISAGQNIPFKTYFRRPNFFRFEWKAAQHLDFFNVVWSDGNGAFVFTGSGALEDMLFENLDRAVGAATGISHRAVIDVLPSVNEGDSG